MALNILFNADDEKQDGYLDSFDSQGRGIDQQFVRGDQSLAVSLRPVVPNTSTNATRYWNDDHQTGDTYQVAIGNPDQAPSSGAFGLSLGGSTTGLTVLTMDATVLTTQISAAHSASYGAAVAALVSPGVFQVTWQTNGAVPQLVVTSGNTLTPDSFVTTVVDKAGDANSRAIQYIVLRQSPVAYCEPSTAFAAASVLASVTQVGDGTHNKKVSITLTPGVYAGSFSVTLTKADSSVSHLVASGTISQDAFATLLGVPCNVTREDDVIRVEFTGAQGLSNTPAIAVSNIDLLVPKGVSGLMDLNTVSLYRQFWQSGSSTSSLPFTLSIKRTRSSGEIAEIFQHPVTLKRNIIDVTTMVDVTLGSYYTAAASDARFLGVTQLDTDAALAANSDAKIASQKAAKSYVDALKIGGNLYATSGSDLAIDLSNRRLKSSDGVTVLDWGHTTDGGNLLNVVFGDGTLTPGNTWGVRINTAGIKTVDGDFGGATFSVDAVTGDVTTAGRYYGDGSALDLGYKIYRATLKQTGTAAPAATVLQNTLGGTVVWTRTAAGQYHATLSGAFPAAKTFLQGIAENLNIGDDGGKYAINRGSSNDVIYLYSLNPPDGVATDSLLSDTAIEILVYP